MPLVISLISPCSVAASTIWEITVASAAAEASNMKLEMMWRRVSVCESRVVLSSPMMASRPSKGPKTLPSAMFTSMVASSAKQASSISRSRSSKL